MGFEDGYSSQKAHLTFIHKDVKLYPVILYTEDTVHCRKQRTVSFYGKYRPRMRQKGDKSGDSDAKCGETYVG